MSENCFHILKGNLSRRVTLSGYVEQDFQRGVESLPGRLEYPHDPLTCIFFHSLAMQIT